MRYSQSTIKMGYLTEQKALFTENVKKIKKKLKKI